MLNMFLLLLSTKEPVYDRKVAPLAPLFRLSSLIHLGCLVGQRQLCAGLLGRKDGEPQVLPHQADTEPSGIIPARRRSFHDARHGVVDLTRPALSSADVDDVGEDLGV